MLFAIRCLDKPDHGALRRSTRPAHLTYLGAHAAALVSAGALLGQQGEPVGSLLMVDVADEATAHMLSAGDPFAKAGLFASVEIHPFRQVFAAGLRVG